MPQPRLRSPLHNLRGQTIICPPMGIEPRLLRFYAGALTARLLALVAEWLSEQQTRPRQCTVRGGTSIPQSSRRVHYVIVFALNYFLVTH